MRGLRPFHIVLGLSLIGAGVSSYLTYEHYTRGAVFCAGYGGCEAVLSSRYASLGGLPISLLGLVMYLAVFGLALAEVKKMGNSLPLLAIFTISLAGTIYSGYLTYVSKTELGAFCLWCLASAATITAILALSLWGLAAPRALPRNL